MYEFYIREDTPRVPTNRHWQFCVGSGQAKLAVRSDWAEQLKIIHDELGIERVRFHGIFNDSMQAYMGMDDFLRYPYTKNFKNYNFMNIAAAYDNVLAAGMKPFVEMSFMPSRLAGKRTKGGVNDSSAKCMPKDEDAYRDFIRAFIEFLIKRYGKEEVEQWYFEVWNEPDIIAFFHGRQHDYFRLYEMTARIVKEVDPNIRVGGPASSECKWIPDFTEYMERNHVPVDFISSHMYPVAPLGNAFTATVKDMLIDSFKRLRKQKRGNALDGIRLMMTDRSELTEWPKGQMGESAKKLNEEAEGYPVYMTEWNGNATLSVYSNDTRKLAAFQIKSIVEMEPYLTGSSIWCFSDIFDEYMLLPYEFVGGFGLLTLNGIPKPAFHALKLMKQVGDRRYDLPITNDEIETAVYESDTQKQIFVFRHRLKTVSEPPEAYRVQIELPWECRDVELYRIDEDHCNPLKIYERMGSPEVLSRDEIEQIKKDSALMAEAPEYTLEGKTLTLTGSLSVNDVHCYTVSR